MYKNGFAALPDLNCNSGHQLAKTDLQHRVAENTLVQTLFFGNMFVSNVVSNKSYLGLIYTEEKYCRFVCIDSE